MKRQLICVRILLIVFLTIAFFVKADHYYGGYITYEHINGYKYKVTVITYANNSKEKSDRDSIQVIWGDGTKEFIQRVNNSGIGDTVFNEIKKNIYEGFHEYSDFGNYQLVFVDKYRPHGVKNIQEEKSQNTLLYIDAIVPVEDSLFFCKNNAPLFLTEPFIDGRPGDDFYLSLTHYDVDGDSLVFKLIEPKAKNSFPVPNYDFPDDVSINSKNGLFMWKNTPSFNVKQIYAFAYEIEEYREGKLIGVSIADFPVQFKKNFPSKGNFSSISGPLVQDHYHFNGPEVIDLIIDYENNEADSVFIDVFSGLSLNSHFRLTNYMFSSGTKAFDTLEVNYFGEDNSQGNHIITFRAGNVYDSDTVFDYHSFSLSTQSDTTWSCIIPSDIRNVEEITPIVDEFTITPNLFNESVWINLGDDFKNITLEVFDMRGRRISKVENSETNTFKIELQNLHAGMYFFRFFRNNELITVLKSVKK